MNNKFYRDIFINIFASLLCTATLNLIIYPGFAKIFSVAVYGDILTVIGIINLLIAVLGNCLNNTRLVLNKFENIKNEEGNYNAVLFIVSVIGSLIGVFLFSLFQIKTFVATFLVFITVLLGIARAYYVVYYRLNLDYYSQLKANLIVATGYILGLLLIKSIDWWPLPFCLGEACSFYYTFKKGTLRNEPFHFTKDRKIVISTYLDLFLNGIIGNILVYFDRFLINPILGSASVAIFSVAVFWGKSVTPLLAPIASVMLSYLCQKNTDLSVKHYVLLFLSTTVPLLLFGIIGIWFGPWITGILYPTLIQDALPYLIIASAGSLVQSTTSLLGPVLLSICSSRAILFLNLLYFGIYLISVSFAAKSGGLQGFCIAVFVVGLIKTILYFGFGFYVLRKEREHAI